MTPERIAKDKGWVKRQHDSSAWLIVNAKEHDLSAKDIASAEESYRVTADLLLLLDECEKAMAGENGDAIGNDASRRGGSTPSPGSSDDERALLRHFDKWVDCPVADISDHDGEYLPCPKCEAIRSRLAAGSPSQHLSTSVEDSTQAKPCVTREQVKKWVESFYGCRGHLEINNLVFGILREIGVNVVEK